MGGCLICTGVISACSYRVLTSESNMKIYKFKDLRDNKNHVHLYQIIDENRIWCAAPSTLNDDREFSFEIDYRFTEETTSLLYDFICYYGNRQEQVLETVMHTIFNNKLKNYVRPIARKLVRQCRSQIGVTSFSTKHNCQRLWDEYGGHGNGAIVEFELPDSLIGKTFHLVNYVDERIFHMNEFLRYRAGHEASLYRHMLCTKLMKWSHEEEIRFLGRVNNVSLYFDIPITSVFTGPHVPTPCMEEIYSKCQSSNIRVQEISCR